MAVELAHPKGGYKGTAADGGIKLNLTVCQFKFIQTFISSDTPAYNIRFGKKGLTHNNCNVRMFLLLCGTIYLLSVSWNKWKNHFSEIKGDVGMHFMKKKGNKKMPIP